MPNFYDTCQIFQQDSAPCHIARIVKQWLAEPGVQLLDWPGNSPDLNPIENLWVSIKKRVAQKKCSSLEELRGHTGCMVSRNYPRSLLQIGGVHAPKTAAGAKEQGLSNQVLTVTILTRNHHIKKFSFFYFECAIHALL